MSTATKSKSAKKTAKPTPPVGSLIWFEVPASDMKRARKFYSDLFGWKIQQFPTMPDYWHMDTGGADASPDGGMLPRMHKNHTTTVYICVPSVTRAMARIRKLGGSICKPKTAVPQMGYFAIAEDTEGNSFAVWEINPKAR